MPDKTTLECLNPHPEAGPLMDLVFVHGLDGDPRHTWQKDNSDAATLWPSWIAADRSDTRVWLLGYPAPKWTTKGTGDVALQERATGVLSYMVDRKLGRRPTIFIAHSLGGLLVKQMLRIAAEIEYQEWGHIIEATRAVVFLGTPHTGSHLAGPAQNFLFKSFTTEIAKGLVADDAHLGMLQAWYRKNAEKHNIRTRSYYETLKLKNVCRVVEKGRAHPGVGPIDQPIDGDHISMTKISTREAPLYHAALAVLNEIGDNELENSEHRIELSDQASLTLSVDPTLPSDEAVASDHLYRNDDLCFQFVPATGNGWHNPEVVTSEIPQKAVALFGSDQVTLSQSFSLGEMLGNPYVLIVRHGEEKSFKLKPETTTPSIERSLKRLWQRVERKEISFNEKDLDGLKRQLVYGTLRTDELPLQTRLELAVYDKKRAEFSAVPPTKENVFLAISRALPELDMLDIRQNNIIYGASQDLFQVEIDGMDREVTINTFGSLWETDCFIYCANIIYSPQSDAHPNTWSELQGMVDSFQILT